MSAMRPFPHPNTSNGWKCPVCKTSADKPVVLVPIAETDDPTIFQAEQVHEACWKVVSAMQTEASS